MVRWSDGLYGGLIAGLISVLFFLVAGALSVHQSFGDFFTMIAVAILGDRIKNAGFVAVLFGIAVHFITAGLFGMLYAFLAERIALMWKAPTSVLSGITYGIIVWFTMNDVIVPIFNIPNIQPLWVGLVGNIMFFGLVLSEYITIARRRNVTKMANEPAAAGQSA